MIILTKDQLTLLQIITDRIAAPGQFCHLYDVIIDYGKQRDDEIFKDEDLEVLEKEYLVERSKKSAGLLTITSEALRIEQLKISHLMID